MSIKAIETVYRGYKFRSRLEARYAVLFDALGLEWEYEAEGYDMGDAGRYLPDFWLPGIGWHIEIKPDSLTISAADLAKIKEFDSNPPKNDQGELLSLGVIVLAGTPAYPSENMDYFCARADVHSHRRITDAVVAARSARFEHGEQPVTVKRVQPAPVAVTPDWYGLEDYLIGLLYEASASLVEMDAYLVSRNQTPISLNDFEQPDNRALWLALQDCTEPTGSASERLTAIMGKLAMRPMALIQDMPREIALTLLRARENRFKNTLKLQETSLQTNPKNTEAALVVNAVVKDLETVRRCLSTTFRAH